MGADILGTAVSPSRDQIGKLGAVAVIRTGLNFFLSMEMKEKKEPLLKSEWVAAASVSGLVHALSTVLCA